MLIFGGRGCQADGIERAKALGQKCAWHKVSKETCAMELEEARTEAVRPRTSRG